jgi:hypothetical protein
MGREIQYGGLVSLRQMMDASRQNRYFWPLGQDGFSRGAGGRESKGQGLDFFFSQRIGRDLVQSFLGKLV